MLIITLTLENEQNIFSTTSFKHQVRVILHGTGIAVTFARTLVAKKLNSLVHHHHQQIRIQFSCHSDKNRPS